MKLNKNIKFLIAADGGAASGKSTASKMIAKKYGFKLLISGSLYRYIAFKLLNKKKINKKFLKRIVKTINLTKLKNKKLYSPMVTEYTSKIAKIKKIRDSLKSYQKNFSKNNKLCIIEGRDIASVIAPHADLKIFFKASLNIKAKRRFKEYRRINKKISLYDVKKAIKLRDLTDTKRKISPLRPAKGCIVFDTSRVNKKQMISKLSKIIEETLKKNYGRTYKTK